MTTARSVGGILRIGWALAAAALVGWSVAQSTPAKVYVVLFNSPGCEGCEEGERIAKQVVEGLPYAELIRLNAEKRENFELFQVLADRAGLDPSGLLVAPSLFVDTDYLDLRNCSVGDVRRVIEKYREVGTGEFWKITAAERANAQTAHIERFKRFTLVPVLLAGLLDGINPCAFATIMFLLSYLAWLGRTRVDVLLAGIFFAFGIFAPYYLIGAGLLRFSRELTLLPLLRHWLFEIVAAAAAAFGVLSFLDAKKASLGRTSEMVLKLPTSLQTRIHSTIKETTRLGMVGGAFVGGIVCALLEAVCTGQIYLPTLVYVAGLGTLRSKAFAYLLAYNLAFVAPLIAITLFAYAGLSSRVIAKFMQTRVALVKIAMGVVFLILAALLHFTA